MRAALARELGYTRTRDRSVPCRVKASIAYRTVKSNAIRDYYSAVNRGGGGALCWCVVNERLPHIDRTETYNMHTITQHDAREYGQCSPTEAV